MARQAKIWKDRNGNPVPKKYVPAIDKKKTAHVDRMVKEAEKLHLQIKAFKTKFLEGSDEVFEAMQKDANVRTGEKGNYTISAFDGKSKIEVQMQNRIEFTQELEFAKEKFDQWKAEQIDKLEKLENNDVKSVIYLVDHAFTTSRGKLDTKKVLDLLKYPIKDALWLEGIELLKKSIHSKASKRYGRVLVTDKEGAEKVIDLNFSSIES
jgi:hypothetical protein